MFKDNRLPPMPERCAASARFPFTVDPIVRPLVTATALVSLLFPATTWAADFVMEEAAVAPPEQSDNGRFGGVRRKLDDWKVTVGVGAVYLPE
ncbi:hypothetical protein [Agrobacterium sp. a22-2]|uniref:hypothetical protein n=1 Tax=Agrobacterium sp. a22-2 TaxID=2283840 RepID=UPI001FEDADEC|nr:hypothetical protein [Agrobacterium sp. a22-2]